MMNDIADDAGLEDSGQQFSFCFDDMEIQHAANPKYQAEQPNKFDEMALKYHDFLSQSNESVSTESSSANDMRSNNSANGDEGEQKRIQAVCISTKKTKFL